MRRLHPARWFSVAALVCLTSTAVLTASGPAGAAGGTVACTDVSGGQMTAALFYDCSPDTTTGGGGTIATTVFKGTRTGTIDWDAPSSTTHASTVIHVTTRVVPGKKTAKSLCPPGTKELRVSGTVRSDSSGSITVGAGVSGILCMQISNKRYALAAGTSFLLGS